MEGHFDRDLGSFRMYTHALLSYLWNAGPQAVDNPLLLDTVKERMSQPLQVQYNQYLALHHCPDNNQTVAQFLQIRLACEDRARENAAQKNQQSKTLVGATGGGGGIGEMYSIPDEPIPRERASQEDRDQVHAQSKGTASCLCCKKTGHKLGVCETFYLMGPLERRAMAAEKSLCYSCLSDEHHIKNCPQKNHRCGICGMKHHFLLHPPSNVDRNYMNGEQDGNDDLIQIANNHHLSCGLQQTEKGQQPVHLEVALTYFTAILRHPTTRKEIKVNLLADTGANTSCLDVDVARELELKGEKRPYHVQVGGGKTHSYSSFAADVEIQGVQNRAKAYQIRFQVYRQPCGLLERVDWADAKQQWDHFKELDLPTAAPGPIQGIVGTQDFILLAPVAPAISKGRHDPVAFQTRLGWMIGGRVTVEPTQTMQIHAQLMNNDQTVESLCCKDTRAALARIWMAEGPAEAARIRGLAPVQRMTASEKAAEEIFQRTQQRREDGRYEVGLLWKPHVYLPSNYQEALDSFYQLERRMAKCPEMKEQFVNTIRDWENKGIVSYLSPHDSRIRYILPTFMVVRLDKATTSYRLVVDGARRFHGTSINDKLFVGPVLINNLQDVLVRFRQGKHAVTCDISMMYLNIRVADRDRDYLCIFFRERPWKPLRVARLNSHPFGLSSSPFVAMKAVQHHASLRKELYPKADQAVREAVLVDDFVLSGNSPSELKTTIEEVQSLVAEMGMELHKFAASHQQIISHVPRERIAKSKVLGEEETSEEHALPTVKTLGLTWDAEDDTFAVNFHPKFETGTLTLRKVVSDGGRLYDPLGLILPVAMTGRVLQQLCWTESQGWDEPLGETLSRRWREWVTHTKQVPTLKIPRAIIDKNREAAKQRLMVFADASGTAQAAVAYIQTLYTDGRLEARLLASRGKVTSLRKQESIPRLECLAAALGAELGFRLSHVLGWHPGDVYYFSDSMTTLWWIKTPKPLKIFVANRVCNILDASEVHQWRYVNTKDNPADIPTRTTSVRGLAEKQLWWWGPSFLTRPESQWPAQPEVIETPEGLEDTKDVDHIAHKLNTQAARNLVPHERMQILLREIWAKYSGSRRGFRVMSVVHRALTHWLRQGIAPDEARAINATTRAQWEDDALEFCIRGEQTKFLPEIMAKVKDRQPLPKRYACWRLFIDGRGILRINGRLAENRTTSLEERNPIFLTTAMPIAKELAKMTHEDNKHAGGAQHLMADLRTKFWIEHGLTMAKRVLKECSECARNNARTIAHQTAPLHYTRTDAPVGRVFHSIGIDMFGPMEVTQGRGKPRGKRYGLIITCCFSRAISVEVMRDASADSCLMAFKRHAAIYGQPEEINSDQGTNLQYARKVLMEIQTVWEDAQPLLKDHFPGIKWRVNPPYSPSYGGHYEALIKVLKNTFKHIARWPKYSFTDEQLITGLKEAAAMANMRPLTEVSTDPNDPPPLRPSDFLHRKILGTTPDWRSTTMYRRVKDELDQFQQELWTRMRKEVLSGLQKVKNWDSANPVEEGDLVFYKSDEWRPDLWPLARVVSIFPGKDGEKRVMKLRYCLKEDPNRPKEGIHSSKNVFKLMLPEPLSIRRLTRAWKEHSKLSESPDTPTKRDKVPST